MLILKAFINHKKIDEIHIWNTGECTNPELGMWKYKILRPEGFEGWYIIHKRDDGYLALLKQVIDIIMLNGDNNEKT